MLQDELINYKIVHNLWDKEMMYGILIDSNNNRSFQVADFIRYRWQVCNPKPLQVEGILRFFLNYRFYEFFQNQRSKFLHEIKTRHSSLKIPLIHRPILTNSFISAKLFVELWKSVSYGHSKEKKRHHYHSRFWKLHYFCQIDLKKKKN